MLLKVATLTSLVLFPTLGYAKIKPSGTMTCQSDDPGKFHATIDVYPTGEPPQFDLIGIFAGDFGDPHDFNGAVTFKDGDHVNTLMTTRVDPGSGMGYEAWEISVSDSLFNNVDYKPHPGTVRRSLADDGLPITCQWLHNDD